jgi:transglycosylase-like protein with SLT domain
VTLHSTMPQRVARWLPHARAAELVYGVDAHLLLAIVDRESNGGEALHPRGPGGTGDGGHGHGLGQIDDRYHSTFLAAKGPDGALLWTDPAFNLLYAAKLLALNIHMFDGSGVNPQLPAIAAYNVLAKRVREVVRALPRPVTDEVVVAALDALTTGHNYVSDVLVRRKSYVLTT